MMMLKLEVLEDLVLIIIYYKYFQSFSLIIIVEYRYT